MQAILCWECGKFNSMIQLAHYCQDVQIQTILQRKMEQEYQELG